MPPVVRNVTCATSDRTRSVYSRDSGAFNRLVAADASSGGPPAMVDDYFETCLAAALFLYLAGLSIVQSLL
jgi:hypothetical protein